MTVLTDTGWREQTPTNPGVRVAAAAYSWLGIPAADVAVLARRARPVIASLDHADTRKGATSR